MIDRLSGRMMLGSLLLILSACSADQPKKVPMPEPDEAMVMKLRAARKVVVVSSDIALKYADMVFRRNYGEAALENQLPLTITDLGDRWKIDGTFRKQSSQELDDPEGGQLTMTILKTNGRILDLARLMILPFPPPGFPLPYPPPASQKP